MRIEAIDVIRIALPIRRPHTWAGNAAPIGRDYVVVKVHIAGGIVGYGEAQVLKDWGGEDQSRFGEAPQTTELIINSLLTPALIGEDVRHIPQLHRRMDKAIKGYPYAKAALDVAFHDAVGKIYGVPVYQLLGGLVRERIPVAHSIGLMDTDVAIREAKEVLAEGVTTLKVKIGIDAQRDIDLVRRLRAELGPNAGLRVDANQGYRSWKEALRVLRAIEDCNILFFEQPVEGLENMARIAQATHVPIMADESAWTPRDVLRLSHHRAAEMISCYYTKPGGLMPAKALLSVAEAAGIRSDINGSAEMGIGNAANLHLAAACAAIDLPGTIPITSTAEVERTKIAGRYYMDDIVVEPFVYENGTLKAPNGPGLGIEVDESKLRKYRVPGTQGAA